MREVGDEGLSVLGDFFETCGIGLYGVRHDVHILCQLAEFEASALAYANAVVAARDSLGVGIEPAERAEHEQDGHEQHEGYRARGYDADLAHEVGLLLFHGVYLGDIDCRDDAVAHALGSHSRAYRHLVTAVRAVHRGAVARARGVDIGDESALRDVAEQTVHAVHGDESALAVEYGGIAGASAAADDLLGDAANLIWVESYLIVRELSVHDGVREGRLEEFVLIYRVGTLSLDEQTVAVVEYRDGDDVYRRDYQEQRAQEYLLPELHTLSRLSSL